MKLEGIEKKLKELKIDKKKDGKEWERRSKIENDGKLENEWKLRK